MTFAIYFVATRDWYRFNDFRKEIIYWPTREAAQAVCDSINSWSCIMGCVVDISDEV